jgi:hypothetical protein
MGTRRDESVSGDLLERGLDLLRDQPIEVDGIQIAATRTRVLESLDRNHARRRRSVGTAIAAIILGTGTLSWAVATGRMDRVMEAVGLSEPAPVAEPAARPRRVVATVPATQTETEPVTETEPEPATETETEPATETETAAVTRPRLTDRERRERALFRAAHDLHFETRDPAAALAAWDAYLATAPAGKLVVEARYNRALALVRLGHKAEAIAALEPFARGEVLPAGYRQQPARELLRALGAPVADTDEIDSARPDSTGGVQ